MRELKRLQDENDNLVGKTSAKSAEMEAEGINLPTESMDDLVHTLLKMRDDLIKAKVAKETLEDKLASEVSFLKTQLQAEQQSKEAVEDQLSSEWCKRFRISHLPVSYDFFGCIGHTGEGRKLI